LGQFGIGQPVRRVEDPALLRGDGRYTDDIALPGQAYGFVLRSPHANARIAAIDAAPARTALGVLAVYTYDEVAKLGSLPCEAPIDFSDGRKMVHPPRPVLAQGQVRYVGDPVAFVVAETLDQARDGAERIEIAYEPLPAVV
jgi:carbon-monoxide dehydrogenase large subunit